MGVLFVPVLAGIMYRGKKTNVAGIASIVAGAGTWLWFNFNPVTLESAGTIDAVIIALPVSFLAFVAGNFFGKDLTAEREGIFEKALQAGRSLEDSGLNEFDRKMIREAQAEVQSDPKDLKVAWLGIDGALVLLYIVLACIYGYGLLHQVDFVVSLLEREEKWKEIKKKDGLPARHQLFHGRTQLFFCIRRGKSHGIAADKSLAAAECSGVIGRQQCIRRLDPHQRQGDPQLLRCNLAQHGLTALADVAGANQQVCAAVVVQHDQSRTEPSLEEGPDPWQQKAMPQAWRISSSQRRPSSASIFAWIS